MSYCSESLNRAIEVFSTKKRAEDRLVRVSAELGTAPNEMLDTKEGCERLLLHIHSVDLALNME